MTQAAVPIFVPARPTFKVDGDEKPLLSSTATSMAVEETAAGLYSCEATFTNWGSKAGSIGYLHFDRDVLDFGKRLEIEAGSSAAAGRIFDGKITAMEGRFPQGAAPEISILAEDALQDLRMIRRTRTFEQVSFGDMLQQIAQDHGLSSDTTLSGPTYAVVAQVNQSDLAFLRQQARAVDAELWLEDGTLFARTRANRRTTSLTLTYPVELLQFTVTADLSEQRTSLAIGGWDVQGKQEVLEEVNGDVLGSELGTFTSGPSILQQAFGERAEQIVHQIVLDSSEAAALAEAEFKAIARRFVRGVAIAQGDARLRVGQTVHFQGLGALFDGAYYAAEARHVFDQEGYFTHLVVERPGIGAA